MSGNTRIPDASGLKVKGVTLRSEIEVLEGENILKVVKKYFLGKLRPKVAPFDYSWALQLHAEMFGDVWNWAGVLRQHNPNIGVPFQQVEAKLFDLMACLPYWKDSSWLEQAAMLHHRAVEIHPFKDGNGRWSRMISNIWLRLHDQPYTTWPETLVRQQESVVREEYLAAMKAGDKGDYEPLFTLQRRFTPES